MSFAYVAAAVAIIGAGIGAVGAANQASAQKKNLHYQAAIAANNKQIADWQRSSALQEGQAAAEQATRDKSLLLGRQRAALSASGVDITQGSAQDILATTEFLSQQDVNTIQSNAARTAFGYTSQSDQFKNDAAFSNAAAKNINPGAAGAISGASSLLSSASLYAGSRIKR